MPMIDLGSLAVSLAMAVAAGLIGCFAVMRRMTLAADAISHIALPGIGVALALHLAPLWGAVTALAAGVLLIWALERRTRITTETLIGVVFSTALAVGSLLTPEAELVETLFGHAGTLSRGEVLFGLGGAALVTGFVVSQRQRLILALVSPDVALTSGIRVARLNLMFLGAFALTVALGLRYLGVLLMGSLVIIPAAAARNAAHSLSGMLIHAVLIAVLATGFGTAAANQWQKPTGPLIISVAALAFVLSLGWSRR